jgi:hypothetical protein
MGWLLSVSKHSKGIAMSHIRANHEGAERLVGCWTLVSWKVMVEGEPQDLFGAKPKGSLILTASGRAIALTTAETRTPGDSEAQRAALHKSMLAYTGRYRIEGDEFVTTVDASWNEAWNGTEQRRRFRFEGDRLIIESVPAIVFYFRARWTTVGWTTVALYGRGKTRILSNPAFERPATSALRLLAVPSSPRFSEGIVRLD